MKRKSFSNSVSQLVLNNYIDETVAWADIVAREMMSASSFLAHEHLVGVVQLFINSNNYPPPCRKDISKQGACGQVFGCRIEDVDSDRSVKKSSKHKFAQGPSATSGGLCLVASSCDSVIVRHSSCRIGNAVSLSTINRSSNFEI